MLSINKLYKMYPKKVWILTLISFIFITRKTIFNVAREVGTFAATVDSGTSLALLGLGCTFLYFCSHFRDFSASRKYMWSILVYYLFAWCSILWAGSYTAITFKALESIANILLVGAIVYNIKDSKKLILYIILYATASTYMDLVGYYMRMGFKWYHTNAYTISAFIGMLLSIGCIKNKLFTFKELSIPLILCIYAWVSGTSTASYISAIIGGIILYASGKKGVNIANTLFTCIFIYLLWFFAEEQIIKFIIADHSQEMIESGTGRDFIWQLAFEKWSKAIWFGHGFIVGEHFDGYSFNSCHNSFISALLGTGLVGFFIFCSFIYKWCITSFRASFQNVYASITFPVIIAIFVNLNACPALASHWSFITNSVLIVVAATFISFRDNDLGDNRTLKQLSKR